MNTEQEPLLAQCHVPENPTPEQAKTIVYSCQPIWEWIWDGSYDKKILVRAMKHLTNDRLDDLVAMASPHMSVPLGLEEPYRRLRRVFYPNA